MRRDLCESAKQGRLCIDDLCRTGGETLCGFDKDEYDEMVNEEYNDGTYEEGESWRDDDCMDCGMCDECVRRTQAYFAQSEREDQAERDSKA